ncbi:carbohydrate binding domain-containing protein, partial [Candidatus Curtissbacteria bacterium]|nr:carbohydrate binding domain-containing protein [Candidatus Curtissbacteria bacterium]
MAKLAALLVILSLLLISPKNVSAVTLFSTDFEDQSLSGWSASGGGATAVISQEAAKSGNYSIKVTHDKTSSYGFQTTIQNIEQGMFYEASAYGKSQDPNVNVFFVRVAWYSTTDGSGSQLSSPNDS